MKYLLLVSLILLLIMALAACTEVSADELTINAEIQVPDGYTFIGASAHGQYFGAEVYYCENNESGKVYECTNGVIGKEIVIPSGYKFAGASAHGKYFASVKIYCRHLETGRVFVCN